MLTHVDRKSIMRRLETAPTTCVQAMPQRYATC